VLVITIPIGVAFLFAAGGTLAIASAIISYAMIGKINRKLPEDQQIGYVLFYPSKGFRITREYRRLYPGSHLNMWRIVLIMIGGILVIASAVWYSHFMA
jgi:hypothetical protein